MPLFISTIPVFAITATVGSTVVVPDNTGNLVKEDHLFIGWITETDGTGNYFYPDDTLSIRIGGYVNVERIVSCSPRYPISAGPVQKTEGLQCQGII